MRIANPSLPSFMTLLSATIALSACAPITTTVRHETRVLSSRSEDRRSSEWTYTATTRSLGADADGAFGVEVEAARARSCSRRTTRSIREVTIADREFDNLLWPVGEWLVGVGGTVASVILFAIEPAGARDPMTGEFRVSPTGIGGILAGAWGLTGLTLGVVDVVRVVDQTEEGDPRTEGSESPPEECEREPAAAASIEVLSASGAPVAMGTSDASGAATMGVSRDALLADGAALRLRVAGRDAGPFYGLDAEYGELRRVADAHARLVAEREQAEAAARATAEREAELARASAVPALAPAQCRASARPLRDRLVELAGMPRSAASDLVDVVLALRVVSRLDYRRETALTSTTVLTLARDGLDMNATRAWIDAVLNDGDPEERGLLDLLVLLFGDGSVRDDVATCTDLLVDRIQDCEALVAAARCGRLTPAWRPPDDGSALRGALVRSGMSEGDATRAVSGFSVGQFITMQRSGQGDRLGGEVWRSIVRMCPAGSTDPYMRLRVMHEGPTIPLVACIASLFLGSLRLDAATMALADSFHLTTARARGVLEWATSYLATR
jgi:hypothetical protein